MLSALSYPCLRDHRGMLQLASVALSLMISIVCSCSGNADPAKPVETDRQEAAADAAAAGPSGWAPCPVIASTAAAYGIPLNFFMRLIWQESRFNRWAISRAGAQGIAQFMPKTAQDRQLANPFDPLEALVKSAELLSDLKNQFGNFGLAAAAYNAGPRRVRAWLEGSRQLPAETRAYVRLVTGSTAQEWLDGRAKTEPPFPESVPCPGIANSKSALDVRHESHPKPSGKWFVQLFGDRSETKVLSDYQRLKTRHLALLQGIQPIVVHTGRLGTPFWHRLRIAQLERDAAEHLCAKLRSVGEMCMVQRN
jgi:hypothetical protein